MGSPAEFLGLSVSYDVDSMTESLLKGQGDWVYQVTLPFAEGGFSDAQVMMGVLYETGIGVPRNGQQAVSWYRRAAAQGNPIAWSNLGTIYLLGLPDVPPDRKEAAHCFARARDLRSSNNP